MSGASASNACGTPGYLPLLNDKPTQREKLHAHLEPCFDAGLLQQVRVQDCLVAQRVEPGDLDEGAREPHERRYEERRKVQAFRIAAEPLCVELLAPEGRRDVLQR
jgi:hypothetical protein